MATRLRRAEQVEQNRSLVLAAAKRVFLANGYAGATLDAIAEEAGFSKGVVYSQFGSKADLFLALLEGRIEQRARENERIATTATGPGALREILRAASRNATAERGWTRLLIEFRCAAGRDAALNARYAAAHARTIEHLTSVLARIHSTVDPRPLVPLEAMAQFVLAIDSGLTLERTVNAGALPERVLMDLVPRALGLDVS